MKKSYYIISILTFFYSSFSYSQVNNRANQKLNQKLKENTENFFCSLESALMVYPQKKTDNNLNDYISFNFCNGKDKKIIGVVFGQKQGYGYIEISRYKVSVLPYKRGIAKLYLNYPIDKYNLKDFKIIKIIYSDGSYDE